MIAASVVRRWCASLRRSSSTSRSMKNVLRIRRPSSLMVVRPPRGPRVLFRGCSSELSSDDMGDSVRKQHSDALSCCIRMVLSAQEEMGSPPVCGCPEARARGPATGEGTPRHGWDAGIRTPILRSRAACLAIRRRPKRSQRISGRGVGGSRSWRAVIVRVPTAIIGSPVDLDPVRLVDSSTVGSRRTYRKRRGQLQPQGLASSDQSHLFSYLRQILILTEDQPHVISSLMGETDNIESNPDIDPFLVPYQRTVLLAIGQLHDTILVAKATRERKNVPGSEHGKLPGPELMPMAIILGGRHPCIEPNLR